MNTPVLQTIADLCANKIDAKEAIERLKLLGAQPWLVNSVRDIEAQFASPAPGADHLGPMSEAVQKVEHLA